MPGIVMLAILFLGSNALADTRPNVILVMADDGTNT